MYSVGCNLIVMKCDVMNVPIVNKCRNDVRSKLTIVSHKQTQSFLLSIGPPPHPCRSFPFHHVQ